MLRRDRKLRMQIHQVMDVCVFAFSFWLAFRLRSDPGLGRLFHLERIDPFHGYLWVFVILIPGVPLVLEGQGFYSRPLLGPRRTRLWPLFRGCLFMTLGLLLGAFALRVVIARWVVIWFGCISFLLMMAKDELMRLRLKNRLGQSRYRRRFILVGAVEELQRMRTDLTHLQEEIEVAGQLNLDKVSVESLVEMLHELSASGVIVSPRHASFDPVDVVIRACELEGVEVWLVADFFKTQISRSSFDDFYGRPVLVFRSTPGPSWEGVAKQVLDYALAAVLLVPLAPIMAVVALCIKATSPGPVLFRQQRAGLHGRPFTMYKFRTMVSNAEQLKIELELLNEMSGPVFKVSNDPRVTSLGRVLRKFSVDELPQLFNVLRGEMSLVGPRPLPVDEVKRFDDLAHRRRLSMRPGLTCLWQISGRNNLKDFREWVRLDLRYIDNWSLWLDLKILWLTVPVVLKGTGAR
jgi:exopolysaccharide biosynthesis polyprenyl glycosylphosphotransferase